MPGQKDALKAELVAPIGPPKPGVATWYKDIDGNYTLAAVVVGVIGVFLAIYVVH